MRKLIVGLIVGSVMTGALFLTFMGPLSSTPAAAGGEPESSDPIEISTDNTTFRENIYGILQKAGSEIQDSDISRYYQLLVGAYELGESPSGTADGEDPSPSDILPDINKISRTALILPLQEAGKQIKDKELAQFYYKFLASAGWSIEPD
jgi:hypothetical protein